MSNEERRRVLQMVAEGKVSPAEADEVLAAMEPPPVALPVTVPLPAAVPSNFGGKKPTSDRAPRRALRIKVSEGAREVSVLIPSGLTQAQQGFLTRHLRKQLKDHDIDLEDHDIDLSEFLDNLDQWPNGTELLKLSDEEFEIDIHVETIYGQ